MGTRVVKHPVHLRMCVCYYTVPGVHHQKQEQLLSILYNTGSITSRARQVDDIHPNFHTSPVIDCGFGQSKIASAVY